MTLQQCTRADLLWIIDRMCMHSLGKYALDHALNDLEYEKEKARIEKAEEYNKLANKLRGEAIDILAPYDGKKWGDIPMEVIEKSAELVKQAEAADQKWANLMGIKLNKST